MALSAQAIERRCRPTRLFGLIQQQPMLVPFSAEKIRVNGKSAGLSAATYDVRIGHDLVLGVHPGLIVERHIRRYGFTQEHLLQLALSENEPYQALAHTLEDFFMPHDIGGLALDKSTYARVFVTSFNTWIDPGFKGNLTLELVNLGTAPVHYKEGDPACQIRFDKLDRRTKKPYDGKYQHQTKAAHPPRFEYQDGSWT